MEIEVGEYVRNKYGEIGIVTKTYPRLMWRKKKNPSLLEYNEIKSHSKNILDLIEVGDYVNGKNVIEVDSCRDWIDTGEEVLRQDEIKSILTKQQFSNIEYKVGE